MQNFIEIHQKNPELLSSGGFCPPRLDRGIERLRLFRVKRPDLHEVSENDHSVKVRLDLPQVYFQTTPNE